jgi:two-component system, chemotaxis family, protein-glutamate methylesterase/glutaminase
VSATSEPDLRKVEAIVIGASAGGVAALGTLLPALPAQLVVPCFIVLHLPRERPSLLADIFAPQCRRPIVEAQDKEPVAPGTVYIAPPDYHLLIDEGPAIALSTDEVVHFSRPSIDVLFESAADVYGRGLLGIVLSGWNQDGADGLEAVRRAGGLTIVQHPDTAEAPVMPQSALARHPDHLALSLAGIAALLKELPAGKPA